MDGWKVGRLNHHSRAKSVDWRAFTHELVGVLDETGSEYLIKEGLQPYLPEPSARPVDREPTGGLFLSPTLF